MPRALIKAMVACVRPEPMKPIADPACGTGGFFLSAYDYLVDNHQLNREEKEFIDCYKPENRHARKATWSEENPEGR